MNRGRRTFSPGHIGQAILLLAGVWLLIAPTWVGFSHQHLQSHLDEWAGAIIIVVSVTSFVLQWAFGVAEMVHKFREQPDLD